MPPALKSTSEFSAALADAAHRLVVVDFWAAWCGPCVRFAPTFEVLSETYQEGDKARFFKVEEGPQTKDVIAQNQIKAFPSFILYLKQKEVARVSGHPQLDGNSLGTLFSCFPSPSRHTSFFPCTPPAPYTPYSSHPSLFRLRVGMRGS